MFYIFFDTFLNPYYSYRSFAANKFFMIYWKIQDIEFWEFSLFFTLLHYLKK